jgi:hypothetical protein
MTTHREHAATTTAPLARTPTDPTAATRVPTIAVRLLVPGVGDGISRPRLGLRSRG